MVSQSALKNVSNKAAIALADIGLANSAAEFDQLTRKVAHGVKTALTDIDSAGSAPDFGQQVRILYANVNMARKIRDARRDNRTLSEYLKVTANYDEWAVEVKSEMMTALVEKEHYVEDSVLKILAEIDKELGTPFVMPQFFSELER